MLQCEQESTEILNVIQFVVLIQDLFFKLFIS